jgi:RP/EB family microtubule-associated protein
MDERATPAQCDKSRAVWHWVRYSRFYRKRRPATSRLMAHEQLTDSFVYHSAALCQIYDSIFLDLPMARVKFNASTEYQYLENFKILSNTFRKHAVDRPLPTESLVKCKMQDNLEFLQWTKRYWDQYYPGGDYDAVGRRKGAAAAAPPPMASARSSTTTSSARRPAATASAPRTASRQAATGGAASAALQAKNTELLETVQGLERERDFYFSKLRDIELLIQQAMEADPVLEEDEGSLLKQIQTILYSTEVSEDAEFSK